MDGEELSRIPSGSATVVVTRDAPGVASRQWALFLVNGVEQLDLSEIMAEVYESGDEPGRATHRSVTMVTLRLCASCTGQPASRRMEGATY